MDRLCRILIFVQSGQFNVIPSTGILDQCTQNILALLPLGRHTTFKILFGEGWVRDKAVKGIVVVLGLSWGVVVGMDGIPCCCCCRCCCRWRSRLLLVLWAVEYKAGGGSLVGGPSLPMLDPLIDLSLEQTTLSSPSPFPQSSAHQSNRDPHHRTIKAISARRKFFVFSVNFIPF